MTTIVRYGVQYSNGKWEAIGVGRSDNIQDAHLYTKRSLAEQKVAQYVSSNWFKTYDNVAPTIVDFACTAQIRDK